MKLYLNSSRVSEGRYFIENSYVGIVWLEDNKGAEHYVGTYDEAYAIINILDRGELTEVGLSYVHRMEDKRIISEFWSNTSKRNRRKE